MHPNDNGCKKTGRKIAEARMNGAISAKKNVGKVNRQKDANFPEDFEWKGCYNAELTEYEQRIADINKEAADC